MRAREHRQKVLIRARMRAGGLPTDICIRDISSRGMLIQSGIAPQRGTYIEIITPTETIVGRVVWGDDERFGINTRDKVHVAMMVGGRRSAVTDQAPRAVLRSVAASARPTFEVKSAGSRMFEFAILAAFAAAAVATLGSAAYQTLARPFEEVASRVRGG